MVAGGRADLGFAIFVVLIEPRSRFISSIGNIIPQVWASWAVSVKGGNLDSEL